MISALRISVLRRSTTKAQFGQGHRVRRGEEFRRHESRAAKPSASSNPVVVTKFSREKFDVVILDFQMPVMDGLAARQITGRSPGTPILMVTLHASPQLAHEARRVGIRGVCGK